MKTKNLLNIPANGGIPPNENKARVMMNESFGLVVYKPLYASMSVTPLLRSSIAPIIANTARLATT